MLLKIGAALAAVPLALGATVAGTGVMVVDVREAGPHGTRIVVPVPLLLAEAVTRVATVPLAHEMELEGLEHARPYLPAAAQVLAALGEAPDGELVRVDDRDTHVLISKAGDQIHVRVQEPGTNVSVNVPLEAVRQALAGAEDGRVDPAALLGALRRARLTDLVHVREEGGDQVKITIW